MPPIEKRKIKPFFLATVLSLAVFLSLGYGVTSYRASLAEKAALETQIAQKEASALQQKLAHDALQAKREQLFSALSLQARAVYVLDAQQGEVLYQKNADTAYPLASLTKVMTALIASDLPKDTLVPITQKAFPEGASTTSGPLLLGQKWKLWDLLSYTLISSSNEGANALALAGGAHLHQNAPQELAESPESVFVRDMNTKAKDLNLDTIRFYNSSGLDVTDTRSGGYGSAKDVALLFQHVLQTKPEIFNSTTEPRDVFYTNEGTRYRAKNTNILAAEIPGLIASKTGYTDLAGGNLALAFNAGPMQPIIVVVLGSTKEGRFDDANKLIWAGIRALGE